MRRMLRTTRPFDARGNEPDANEAAASWARQRIRVAADLLTYLDNRGLELQALDQRTLDEWLAAGNSTHHTVRDFVKWAVRQRLTQPLSVPLRQVITVEHRRRSGCCGAAARGQARLRQVVLGPSP